MDAGEWGVCGSKDEHGATALHSVVGLGKDKNEALQVDGVDDMMSIVPYAANNKLYGRGSTELYAKKQNQAPGRFSIRGLAGAGRRRLSNAKR
ncbi:MAG TPA: hypothetical protein VLF71_05650 [Candidatus Saccharimonadales bacterium]|nr:hypothetical protein [Candidatus Saccharimonadales bacterium]